MTTCSQAAGGGAESANKRTAQTTARRRAAERGSGVPPARGGRRRPWRTALCWWYRRRCHPPAQAATPWTRRAVRPAPHTTAPARGLWESQSPARRRAAQRALAMGPQEAAGCGAPACSPAAPSSSRTSGTAAGREKREETGGGWLGMWEWMGEQRQLMRTRSAAGQTRARGAGEQSAWLAVPEAASTGR